MINKKVLNLIGYVLFFLGISMLFSATWSYYYSLLNQKISIQQKHYFRKVIIYDK